MVLESMILGVLGGFGGVVAFYVIRGQIRNYRNRRR